MKSLYSDILASLRKNEPLVEVTIIGHRGSAPRTSGAKMLVLPDGRICGTVGGGLYEAKSMQIAKDLHKKYKKNKQKSDHTAIIVYFDLKGSSLPTDMDMVCGGELRLLIEYLDVCEEKVSLYSALVSAEEKGEECTLITQVIPLEYPIINAEKYEVQVKKELYYVDSLEEKRENRHPKVKQILESHGKITSISADNSSEFFAETLSAPFSLYVFGAGHVSYALAKITHFLNFRTIVIDDRPEFSNKERFPQSNIEVLDSLSQSAIEEYLKKENITEKTGIIIVTRGHARDRDALAASLKTKAGYIGMIGSKSKRQTTYDFLLANGYTKEDFEKIHSPIGLNIGADTPEEIAISICAQLIQWRTGKN